VFQNVCVFYVAASFVISLSRIFGKVRALSYLTLFRVFLAASFVIVLSRIFGEVRALSYLSIKQDIAFSCFLCSFLP
jgi:cell division protein FtsB